jgi:hypothetical protein
VGISAAAAAGKASNTKKCEELYIQISSPSSKYKVRIEENLLKEFAGLRVYKSPLQKDSDSGQIDEINLLEWRIGIVSSFLGIGVIKKMVL